MTEPLLPPLDSFPPIMGPTALVRMAFEGQDLNPLMQRLIGRIAADARDAGALMDLATVLLCQGGDQARQGLALQQAAIGLQPTYVVRHGSGNGPRLVAFVVAGDFMANTPVDFLLAGSDATLILHHVDDLPPRAQSLPDHEVAFLAIGEGSASARVLDAIAPALAQWPRPVLNNAPRLLTDLSRDRASRLIADLPGVLAPLVHVAGRQDLTDLAHGRLSARALGAGLVWPMLLRPIGSHGGQGLERLTCEMDLLRWLARADQAQVAAAYLMPFVDYRGADGLFSKYRVAMIGGRPFASHMAQSNHWMVHYLNAEMDLHPERRMEEAIWMAEFDTRFVRRHAQALQAVQRRLGLDYYALDCAETSDGRLLVFEVDTAMIIHDMDCAVIYPYKKPAMRKLFDGFLAAIDRALPAGPPTRGYKAA